MSKKKFPLLLLLFLGVPLFLTGALRRSPTEPAPAPVPVFLPQPILWITPTSDAAGLLDLATERLSPERIAWLHVKVWQRMAAAEVAFESDGSLQIGPDHCARLDVRVRAGGNPGRWLVVSDGRALAHVVQLGKGAPTVTSRLLASDEPDAALSPPNVAAEALRDLGCGGPYPLLKDLRGKLRELTVQTGLSQGRQVARLRGRFDSAQTSSGAGTAVAADFCYLYLEAPTLWPARMEWWGPDRERVQRLLLELEFRDPHLNRPLSLPECIRAFSYRPEHG